MKKLLLTFLFLIIFNVTFAEIPFTDVSTKDYFYYDLDYLYNVWIIKNTSDNLFYPNSLIKRDEFVWIVIWVGCVDCINPTIEDILKYNTTPFVDILKTNPYYYCISKWKDSGIVEWYKLNNNWVYICQNNQAYKQTPFCPENNITKIEATTILLRAAKIYDDELNQKAVKTITIADIDNNWYWFAKKWIEIGLLKLDENNKIYPNEFIKRKDFISMATKIFWINSCELKNSNKYSIPSIVKIFDSTNSWSSNWIWENTTFPDPNKIIYDYYAYTESEWTFNYNWEFTNTTSQKTLIASWKFLDDFDLKTSWEWVIKLTTTDTKTWKKSVSYTQIYILWLCDNNCVCPKWSSCSSKDNSCNINWKCILNKDNNSSNGGNGNLWISMSIDSKSWNNPWNVNFKSIINWWNWNNIYEWNFWDWTFSKEKNPNHTYKNPWIYTIILKITGGNWKVWISQMTIEIKETEDKDNDWILDNDDLCPLVSWSKSNNWCPSSLNKYEPLNITKCDTNCSCLKWSICSSKDKNSCSVTWICLKENIYNILLNSTDSDKNNWSSWISNENSNKYSISSKIKIFDSTNSWSSNWIWENTTFPDPNKIIYDYYAYTESEWTFNYNWEFTNTTSQKTLIASWKFLDDFDLKTSWEWVIKLTTTDTKTWKKSVSYTQIYILWLCDNNCVCPKWSSCSSKDNSCNINWKCILNKDNNSSNGGNGNLWISMSIDSKSWNNPWNVNFKSIINWWNWNNIYEWNFWDWTFSKEKNPNHTYKNPWIYTIILKITGGNWKVWISQMTIEIKETEDKDNDWILDNDDLCPLVSWSKSNNWCPSSLNKYEPLNITKCDTNCSCLKWSICSSKDKNSCSVTWICLKENIYNILLNSTDSDKNNWSSWISNKCLEDKIKLNGFIEWFNSCNSCPCNYKIDFQSSLRICDIIFPAITSLDKYTIFSRWNIYQIK